MKKVFIVYTLLLMISLSVGQEIKNVEKFWLESKYVEMGDKISYNPTYTYKWIEDSGLLDYDVSKLKDNKKIINVKRYFEKAKKNKEICESLFIFDENNKAKIKINYYALNSLNNDQKKDLYQSKGNSFLKKYVGYYVERQEHTGKRRNKTYTYYTYNLVKDEGSMEDLTYSKIISPSFLIGFMGVYAVSPQIFSLSPVFDEAYSRITSKDAVDNCNYYSENINQGLELLYNDMNQRIENSNAFMEKLIENKEKLEYLGVCDKGYSDIGGEECIEIKNYAELNKNGFGEYAEQGNALKKGISGYIESIEKAEEFEENANLLLEKTNYFLEESKKELNLNNKIIDIKLKELKNHINNFEKEKLSLIDGSISFSDTTFLETSVKEDYDYIKEINYKGEYGLKEIKAIISSKPNGWFAQSITKQRELNKKLSKAIKKAELLEEKAKGVINLLEEYVLEELYKLEKEGKETKEIREMMEKAKSKIRLGEKYNEYKKAYEKIILLGLEGKDLNNNYEIFKSKAKNAIEKGEKDGLDLNEEKTLFEHYSSIENKKIALEGFKDIINRVIGKAKLYYFDLQEKRDELNYYLSAQELKKLKLELEEKEGIYVSNGIIDYAKGLGMLSYLDKLYSEYLKKIETMKEKIYSKKIEIYSFYDKSAYENEREKLIETIKIYNPSGVSLENIEVEFDSLFTNDVLREKDGCKVKYRINKIAGYQTKTIEFEKTDGVEIKRDDIEKYVKDDEGFGVESLLIKSNLCLDEIKLKKRYEKINGKFKLYKKESLLGDIRRGNYYLEGKYKISNPYEIKKEFYNEDKISYKYTIKPKGFFDYVVFSYNFLGIDKKEIENIEVQDVRYKIGEDNIKFYDVGEEFSFIIKTNKDNIEKEIEEVRKRLENLEIEGVKKEIEEALKNKKGEELLNYLLGLEEEIKKEKKKNEKGEKYYISLKERIEEEINYLKNFKDCEDEYLKEEYSKRIEKLNNYLKKLNTMDYDEIYSVKSNYDSRWLEKQNKDIVRSAVKKFYDLFNKYKKKEIYYEDIEKLNKEFENYYEKYLTNKREVKNVCKIKEIAYKIKEEVDNFVKNREIIELENKKEIEEQVKELEEKIRLYEKNYYSLKEVKKVNLPSPSQIKRDLNKEIEKAEKTGEKKGVKIEEEKVNEYLNRIKELSEEELDSIENYYESLKPTLDEKTRKDVEMAISKIKSEIEERNYGDAIRISKNVLVLLSSKKQKNKKTNDYLLLIGIVLFLSVFYFRDKIIRLIEKNKEKPKRKIRRFRNNPE